MRTESDLRDAIAELAAEASSADLLLVSLERRATRGRFTPARAHRPRLRLLYVMSAVVAVVAGATLIPAVSGRHAREGVVNAVAPTASRPCATALTPALNGFVLDPVAGLDDNIINASTCAGYRTRWLYTPGGGWIGTVTLFAAGVFDRSLLSDEQKVTGHGITGYAGTLHVAPTLQAASVPCPSTLTSPGCVAVVGFAWKYAPGAWGVIATLTVERGTFFTGAARIDHELAVAAAVRPGQQQVLKSPFAMGNLSGLRPISSSVSILRPDDLGYADGGAQIDLAVPGHGARCPDHAACTAAVSVNVASTVDPPSTTQTTPRKLVRVTDLTGGSRQYRFQMRHWVVDFTITDVTAGVTKATLQRIADTITFASSTRDTATWFRLDQAVPH